VASWQQQRGRRQWRQQQQGAAAAAEAQVGRLAGSQNVWSEPLENGEIRTSLIIRPTDY